MMSTKDDKKQHIIRKGLKAFYRKGYNATGVKEITDAAQIPKGSFYNHFKCKEDFAIESMRYFTEREIAVMVRVLGNHDIPPLERIEKLYAMKVDHFVKQGTFSLGCFLCNITLEMADVSPSIATAASEAFDNEYAPMIDCLKEAQENGDMDSSSDIHLIADLIRNSWLGALVIMKANKNPAPLKSFQDMLHTIILKQ